MTFKKGNTIWKNRKKNGRPKGIPMSEERKKSQGEEVSRRIKEGTWKTPFVKGKAGYRKGTKHTPETRMKMRHTIIHKERTSLIRTIRHLPEYFLWRSQVFQRDNWTCQTCGKRGTYLEAHHIKEVIIIIINNNILSAEQALNCEELWNINNGITLCSNCHQLTKKGGGTYVFRYN